MINNDKKLGVIEFAHGLMGRNPGLTLEPTALKSEYRKLRCQHSWARNLAPPNTQFGGLGEERGTYWLNKKSRKNVKAKSFGNVLEITGYYLNNSHPELPYL